MSMFFIDKNTVMSKIMNNEPISNIWAFNPKDIKGTSRQIADGRGYLILRQISSGMTINDIWKDEVTFVEIKEELK